MNRPFPTRQPGPCPSAPPRWWTPRKLPIDSHTPSSTPCTVGRLAAGRASNRTPTRRSPLSCPLCSCLWCVPAPPRCQCQASVNSLSLANSSLSVTSYRSWAVCPPKVFLLGKLMILVSQLPSSSMVSLRHIAWDTVAPILACTVHPLIMTFPFFLAWRHSQASRVFDSLKQMYLVTPASEKCYGLEHQTLSYLLSRLLPQILKKNCWFLNEIVSKKCCESCSQWSVHCKTWNKKSLM